MHKLNDMYACLRWHAILLLQSSPKNIKKKVKIRNRYNQVPHLTKDTIWESDKNTVNHNKQESQEVHRCKIS